MRVFCISDNIDTEMGLRLAGIESVVLHEKGEVIDKLQELLQIEDIGIILITTKIVNLLPELISEYKLNLKKPLLVEIPDRHGSSDIGKTIDSYISEAIGIKI